MVLSARVGQSTNNKEQLNTTMEKERSVAALLEHSEKFRLCFKLIAVFRTTTTTNQPTTHPTNQPTTTTTNEGRSSQIDVKCWKIPLFLHLIHHLYADVHWIGLRENPQETMVSTIINNGFFLQMFPQSILRCSQTLPGHRVTGRCQGRGPSRDRSCRGLGEAVSDVKP